MAITARKNPDLVISRGDWRLCLCCVVLTRVVLIKSSARSVLNIPFENQADLACRVQDACPCTQCSGKPCAGMQWSAGFPKLAFAKVVIHKVKGSARR